MVKMIKGSKLHEELVPQNASCMHYFFIVRELWLVFLYQRTGV